MAAPTATRTSERQAPGWWLSKWAPHTFALIFWLLSLILFRQPLRSLASLSFHDELASHVLLIPLISALLLYLERKRVFHAPRYCPAIGAPLLLMAAVFWYSLKTPLPSLNHTDHLSGVAALIVLVWIAAFILFYGAGSFRAGVFPLLFLLLMIPLPVVVAERAVSVLQKGSAGACYALFHLIGVPVIRHGFRFSLPGVEIEVGEQCSGIHSALSLFIAGLLAEHALLRGTWKKACFTACIVPIAMFKNAIRIVTIAWLGIHVDPAFFQSALHRRGGLPFSLVALALMALLLWLLRYPFTGFKTNHSSRRLDSGIA